MKSTRLQPQLPMLLLLRIILKINILIVALNCIVLFPGGFPQNSVFASLIESNKCRLHLYLGAIKFENKDVMIENSALTLNNLHLNDRNHA